MTFPQLANLHAGLPAVVIGKGPSLDAWLAAGCPQPDGAVRIGVNHVGGAVACDYNVSVHSDQPEMDAIPGLWLRGIAHGWNLMFKEVHWQLPNGGHWMLTGSGIALLTDRDQVADCRWFYCESSSTQPAIQFAWYLGCSNLILVGIDGGSEQAAAAKAVPGGISKPQDYGRMLRDTHHVADTLFGTRWRHWMPPACGGNDEGRMTKAECPTGEKWKYDGIYGPGGLPGYGHSNHGAKALEWLVQRHTSVLDVGCGHNEFVKEWRNQSVARSQCAGVDFACPGADYIAPATALPFTDGQFDLVTAFDVLEHLPEHEVLPALREMARVARWYCFSIATAPSRILWQGQNLHPTVRPLDWWHDRIREAGGVPEMGPPGYVYGRWQASGMPKPE